MLANYQRRVSFDSIGQNKEYDVDDPLHIPPQYLNNSNNRAQLDLNFGFDNHKANTDVLQIFNSFNQIGGANNNLNNYSYKSKKIPKLPPAPTKSILKGEKINYNRKKSIVNMTFDELNAMDKQFRSAVNLDKMKFDTDDYLPLQTSNEYIKKSYTGSRSIKNIDKAVESMVNNKLIKDDEVNNLNSYSSSFKHKEMNGFLKNSLNIKDDEKLLPESLRNIMCFISGKSHTWDSIDYSIKNYLKNGDQLILICQLIEEDPDLDEIKSSINNLLYYIFKLIKLFNNNLIINLKIEFINDLNLKSLLRNSISFFNPQIFFISSLLSNLNLNLNYKILKLPIYILNNLNIPTLVIPTTIEPEKLNQIQDDQLINNDVFLDKLIEINLKADSDFNPNSRIIKKRNIKYENDSESEDENEVSPFFPPTQSIKFDESVKNRRNSSTSSQKVYIVKSLLDEDYNASKRPSITPTTSLGEIKRKLSQQNSTAKSISPVPTTTTTKKKGFLGLFKKGK